LVQEGQVDGLGSVSFTSSRRERETYTQEEGEKDKEEFDDCTSHGTILEEPERDDSVISVHGEHTISYRNHITHPIFHSHKINMIRSAPN
jgi:hypothetical protein